MIGKTELVNLKFNLSKREKVLGLITAAILVPIVIYRFVLVPIDLFQLNLERKNIRLEKKAAKIEMMGQELHFYQNQRVGTRLTLNRMVDRLIRSLHLKSRSNILIENSAGQATKKLILRVNDINLTELAQLTYQIESSRPVISIDNLDIGISFTNKRLLRASYVLSGR